MKPFDFSSWFDEREARFAVLSTFEFDTAHFESRLLRSTALSQARRILVMVDADQFQKSLAEKRPARWINQRYLVVPVRRKHGVFHPKLGLLVGENHARLLCGSNNLTQAGSAHNLELLNSILVTAEDKQPSARISLIAQAFAFFKACAQHGEGHTGKIAAGWLDEAQAECAWLETTTAKENPPIELLHTLETNLWDWLESRLERSPPSKIQVLSPFYDSDLHLLKRIRETWPKCAIEITAQQRTSNLPAGLLKDFGKAVRLFDVEGVGTRRLHAKLLAVEGNGRTICVAGSANFTTAAFSGRNIETCLAWEADESPFKNLFNGGVSRVAISPEDFEPGDEPPPEEENTPAIPLRIKSAILDATGKLSVAFDVAPDFKARSIGIALQNFGEHVPAVCPELKTWQRGFAEVQLKPEHMVGFGAAVACFLIADTGTESITSPISWLIQEHKLTHEPSEHQNGNSRELEVRETGRGLVEHLDEIGTKEGQLQVIQYLSNLSIRFDDNAASNRGGRHSRIQIRDPFRPDSIPDWLKQFGEQLPGIEAAVYEFVDRHERKVLRRHARHANINGVPNFLDVLVAMTKLLFVFHRRGIVKKHQVIGRLVRYLEIFTDGFESQDDASPGYIAGIHEAMSGNLNQFRKTFDEQNVTGHLRALLLIAQTVRCDPKEIGSSRPAQCLRLKSEKVRDCLGQCKLHSPTAKQVGQAFLAYEMLVEDELQKWLKEVV
jgi:hypothetical protein